MGLDAGVHPCGKCRDLTRGYLGGRLSSEVETLRAAPSEGQAESWHHVLSRTVGRRHQNLGRDLGVSPWAPSRCFTHPQQSRI